MTRTRCAGSWVWGREGGLVEGGGVVGVVGGGEDAEGGGLAVEVGGIAWIAGLDGAGAEERGEVAARGVRDELRAGRVHGGIGVECVVEDVGALRGRRGVHELRCEA